MAEKIEKRSVSVRIDGKEIENSYKAIMKEVSALRNENQKLAEDTEGYVRKALSLAQASEAAQKNRDSVKAIAEAWKAMPEDVRQSVIEQQTALLKLREDFGKLMEGGESTKSPAMKAMKAQIQELQAEIVKTTQTYVELQKPAVNSITAIEKEIVKLKGEMEKAELETDQYRQKMSRWQELTAIVDKHKNDLKGIEPAVKGSLEALENDIREVENALNKSVLKSKEYYENIKRLDKLNAELDEHKKEIGQIEDAWYKNIPAIKEFAAVAVGALAIDSVFEYGKAILSNATLLDTYNNKTKIVFESAQNSVKEFSDTYSSSLGISSKQTEKLITDIGDLLVPMRFSREEAAKMASESVRVAGALAEWSGGQYTVVDASKSIQKALTGEFEELERYGVSIRADTINTKLAAQGKDKLKGSLLEQAKAQIVLTEIQNRSTDAQTAFANNQDTLARSSSRLLASFENIKDSIAEGLSPALNSVVGGLANIIAPSVSASQSLAKLQVAFNLEIDTLKTANLTHDARKQLIGEINDKYKAYLPNLLSEKSTIAEIQKAQDEANKSFLNKITLMAAEEKLVAVQKKRLDAKAAELELQKKLTQEYQAYQNASKTRPLARNEASDLGAQMIADGFLKAQKAVNENIKIQEDLQKEFDVTIESAKKLGVEVDKFLNPPKSAQSKDPIVIDKEAAEKRANEILNFVKDFNAKIRAFEADNAQIVKEGYVKEIEKTKEKYQIQLDLLEDFAKKFPEKKKVANDLEKQILKLQTQELTSIIQNQLKTLSDEANKHQQDAELRLKSQEEKEIAAINSKYEKQLNLLIKLENDITNSSEKQRQQAHTLRLTYEANRETEIANMKSKMRFEQAQKDAEENERFWKQMKQLDDQYRALLSEKPATIPLDENGDNLDVRIQNIINIANAERDALNKKFDEQIKIEGDASDRILALNNKRADLLQALAQKTNAQIEKTEKDSIQKRILAQSAAAQELGSLFVKLGDLISGETVKNSVLQKTAALAQIAINTATAIASIVSKSAATSLTPIDYALKVAAGVATVMVNMLTARNILNAAPTVTQKNDGGPVEVVGASDGKTYRPRYRGQATSGMYYEPSLFLAAENKPEYVIAYPEMQNPLVANFLPVIEGIRQRRMVRGYDDGGVTEGAVQAQAISPQAPNAISMPIEMFNMFMLTMSNVNNALEKGIILTYEDVEHIDKMRKSIQAARGYS